jgi:predicted phage terminase large subunit-like protein
MQQKEQEKELNEQIDDAKKLLTVAEDSRVVEKLTERVAALEFRLENEIEKWEVITFPAINTNGDEYWYKNHIIDHHEPGSRLLRKKNSALHPERFDEIALAKIRSTLQKRHWSALFQQNPVPDEGVYFRKEMFRYEPYVSADLWRRWNIFIAWDLAIGQKQANDWTVGLVGAHDHDDRLHIIDMIRVKTDELAELIMNTQEPYHKNFTMMGLERGQIQMAVMPSLKKEMKLKRRYFSFDETLTPITDKSARARPAQAWMQSGRILLPSGQPWVETLTSELLRFPGGVHDDIVDAMAWLVRMVANHEPPRHKKAKKHKSWKDKLAKHTRGDHRGGSAMGA